MPAQSLSYGKGFRKQLVAELNDDVARATLRSAQVDKLDARVKRIERASVWIVPISDPDTNAGKNANVRFTRVILTETPIGACCWHISFFLVMLGPTPDASSWVGADCQ